MFQKTLKNESLHRSQSDGLFTSIFKLNNRLLFIDKVEKKNINFHHLAYSIHSIVIKCILSFYQENLLSL